MAFNPSIDVNAWKLIQWSGDVPKLDTQLTELALKVSTWATGVNQVLTSGGVPWAGLIGKPATFPPSYYIGIDSTNSNAYAITVTSDFILSTGVIVFLAVNTTNTGAPTLNVNGTGAKAIQTRAAVALAPSELVQSKYHGLVYDGSNNWRVFTPITRLYTVTNPVNPTIECNGYDVVRVSVYFTSATGAGITLAHVAEGMPIYIDITNATGAAMSYYVNGTQINGAATVGSNVFVTTSNTASAAYGISSSTVPALANGNHMTLVGSLMNGQLFFK